MQAKAILTVGELIDALSKFPRDQHVRISVPEDMDRFSPHPAQIASNIHEYGLLHNDIWSDGAYTHGVVQIPLLTSAEESSVEPPESFLVKPDDDDTDGEGTYW